MKRRLKYGIAPAGAVVSFCVCLAVLRVWQGPCGLDVYYYALQTKAISATGAQLFSDLSPVYRVLYAINLLLGNPVLSVQVLSSLSIACMYCCLLIIALRKGFSLYKTAAATVAVFNPAVFYLLLEFTKNSFAFALFFLSWVLLTDEDNKIHFNFKNPASAVRSITGLAFLGLSAFSHRLMLALFLCFVIQALVVFLKPRVNQLKFIIPALIIVLLVAAAIGLYLRTMILERLSIISLGAPVHRMTQFIRGGLLAGERVLYIFMQVAVFFLVPAVVIRRRQFFQSEGIFAAVSWLFLFPFIQFSWNEIGFRLLILAPLMLGPWLISLNIRFPKAAAIVFFGASVLFTAESARNLAVVKGPDYREFRETFKSIEDLAGGRRLIVHRGLAGFLWYEKGIRSENFLPAVEPDRYLRLVYAFSPDILEYYLESDDPPPVQIDRTYTLMEEYIWQRFYEDRRELHFLKSEMNPFLPRPVSAFVINEEVSAVLSPVSDAP
ncbi:MAG: hypothetical protein FWG46_02580 [Treponema sp.]|nr:hypothetical protein [Treponema sp.]